MHQLKIVDIISQPGDNITFQLVPVSSNFPSYKAGQFLSLIFHFGEREIRRSYSLNSSPDVDQQLSITVKRIDNGEISRFLHHEIKVGDILTAQDPNGLFVYETEPGTKRTVFLFAAGVGITPLYAILKTALVRESKSKIVLVYSNKAEDNTLFIDELRQWQAKYPDRLHIIWIFSDSKNLLKARLNRFYIEEIIRNELEFDRSAALFYTCGPIFYMDLCRICLLGMGFPAQNIKRETFVLPEDEGDDDDQTEKVVDTNTYTIKLHFQSKTYDLDIPYNKRILDVALENKINLPYSCRAGMCGTCTSNCIKGNVRMDYNEILTDDEVEKGRVLICTGHPTENGTEIFVEG
ncbi:ferredoxin [Pseudopedobacter saltans DSM 12145]|uniref:Ferredoxin n=1 Tax=Pseudopedobacter saltans (strain ATCC 51119 / DSM 12145 / JCM 21818 / CCUG 39354 / LMG 10337 / NBRC 100064 / NCIMB 13643) TaxID=762903 RepID=F0S4G5_PSESL|nr:2Fe-2S iron-sulfur cluster-binding protein [Pseudopedobacter saltans]ADY51956.1 ferredoxin [Pseudopedobacter saltans DSM 12145]